MSNQPKPATMPERPTKGAEIDSRLRARANKLSGAARDAACVRGMRLIYGNGGGNKEKLTMPKKTTTDALKILSHLSGKDPAMQRGFEEEVANREVAQKIFQLRQDSGLSQTELARRVGTTQSVISRLEDADYEGHSLAMLNRIAAAVERRVEIRFVPRKRRLLPA